MNKYKKQRSNIENIKGLEFYIKGLILILVYLITK